MSVKFLTVTTFATKINSLAMQVKADYERLSRLWPQLHSRLEALWPNLSFEECRQIIRSGGDMIVQERHRPEPDAYDRFMDRRKLNEAEVPHLQATFTYPYLTVEDLCYKDSLMLLLEARAN